MRPVRRPQRKSEPVVPEFEATSLSRTDFDHAASYEDGDGTRYDAVCVRCEERWCARFPEVRTGVLKSASDVCPTDAVRFTDDGEAVIGDACFGCGLCVLRCPYGAIAFDGAGRAHVERGTANFVSATAEDARRLRDEIPLQMAVDPATRADFLDDVIDRLGTERKDTYYELAARLLTMAGTPTDVPSHGQNPARFDAVIVDDAQSIPIEIKSPAEEISAGIKAVEQALENKVLLDTRFRDAYPSTPDSATLAIGHLAPPQRSDVADLIDDIQQAFGVNVAVLSIRQLYEFAFAAVADGERLSIERIASLRGVQ